MPPSRRGYDTCHNTVFMLLALKIVISAMAWANPNSLDSFVMKPDAVLNGEVWRMFTYAFVSTDRLFFIFELLVFLYIASPLEHLWGTRRFMTLVGISVIGGSATSLAFGIQVGDGLALTLTLMLIHGFLFPDSVIRLFFILPIRMKTLAIFSTAFFLVMCMQMGVPGLAYFAGMFCGVLYYVFTTRSIPWMSRTKRTLASVAKDPAGALKKVSTARAMERAKKIIEEHKGGEPIPEEDRIYIEELIRRADPSKELCSPHSFSPDNQICPPCEQFGLCLRRYLEQADAKADEAAKNGGRKER